jgi:methylphosphotriester-DNA--protein-cysteine methyltransferase
VEATQQIVDPVLTLDEIADRLKVSKSSARRIFAREPGVLCLNASVKRSTLSLYRRHLKKCNLPANSSTIAIKCELHQLTFKGEFQTWQVDTLDAEGSNKFRNKA